MKNEAPPDKKLDEQTITEAANEAIRNLQLDVEVKSVSSSDERWCVQFTADYGQFSDSFHDQYGKENGFELIREKIKRHILKQQQNKIRANVRIRRGKPQPRPSSDTLLETAVKTIEGMASQTAAVAGDIIKQAASLPETARGALDTAAQIAGTVAAPLSDAAQVLVQTLEQPIARVSVKASAAKPTRKSPRPTRRATTKKGSATKKAATKSRKRAASKPASGSKKPASSIKRAASGSKRAASKSASKPAAKKSRTKKSTAGK